MKSLLFMTWLLIGGAAYFVYGSYQQSVNDKSVLTESLNLISASNADLSNQVSKLKDQISVLQVQLADERKNSAALRLAMGSGATQMPSTSVPSASAQKIPSSIPSTITTLFGKTYTGCTLSRVTPDGISFTHSMGVAKVLFSELDPSFAATFGYDPVAAKKYENDQSLAEAQSDVQRAATESAQKPPDSVSSTSSATSAPAPSLSTEQRASIQAQIDSLQQDIAFMQREEAKTTDNGHTLIMDNSRINKGGYADKIAAEQAQINQLQTQLH